MTHKTSLLPEKQLSKSLAPLEQSCKSLKAN